MQRVSHSNGESSQSAQGRQQSKIDACADCPASSTSPGLAWESRCRDAERLTDREGAGDKDKQDDHDDVQALSRPGTAHQVVGTWRHVREQPSRVTAHVDSSLTQHRIHTEGPHVRFMVSCKPKTPTLSHHTIRYPSKENSNKYKRESGHNTRKLAESSRRQHREGKVRDEVRVVVSGFLCRNHGLLLLGRRLGLGGSLGVLVVRVSMCSVRGGKG